MTSAISPPPSRDDACPSSLPRQWQLGPSPVLALRGRDAIQAYFERANALQRASHRGIELPLRRAHGDDAQALLMTALEMPAELRSGGAAFMFEAELPGTLRVKTLAADSAPDAYSICLPLSGEIALRHRRHGDARALAGEALVIDPLDAELTQVRAGTHFLEFNLPKRLLAGLGAESEPGGRRGAMRFEPVLRGEAVQRLQFAALQAGHSLRQGAGEPGGRPLLFRRWLEMLALNFLETQAPPADGAGAMALPASLRRALDYMHAHLDDELLVADIAAAACVSASSLLRHFKLRLGQTPGQHLRLLRLDRARAELQRGTAGSVREIAARHGFDSPGKFSQAYRRRFGEAPRDTKKLSCGGGPA